jgi:hypothetical protein
MKEYDLKCKRSPPNPTINGRTNRNPIPVTDSVPRNRKGILPPRHTKSEQSRAKMEAITWVFKHSRVVATQSIGPKTLIEQPLTPPLAARVSSRFLRSCKTRGVYNQVGSVLAMNRPLRSVVCIRVAELSQPRDVTLIDIRNLLGRQARRVAIDAARIGVASSVEGVRRFGIVQGRSGDEVRRPCVERKGIPEVRHGASEKRPGQESRGAFVLAFVE